MAKNKIKIQIDEPILYSFIKNEFIWVQNFNEIKSVFDKKENIEDDIKNIFQEEKLKEYIENVFFYQKELKINFRYYQFLAILFTEIFLDNFFNNKQTFLNKINYFIEKKYIENIYWFNSLEEEKQKTVLKNLKFEEKNLWNIAFWMATWSWKTYVSLANLLQFEKYNKEAEQWKKLDNKIFITFNDDLLNQFKKQINDINWLKIDSLKWKNLEKNYSDILWWYFQWISLIKKWEKIPKDGESFYVQENKIYWNNLVLVDEAHLWAKSDNRQWNQKWAYKTIQEKLKWENWLKIEYSATFHDVINNEENDILKENCELIYIKSIIFDYNYHKFHNDWFWKDYDFITAKWLYKKTDKSWNTKNDEKWIIEDSILNEFSLSNIYFYLNQLKEYQENKDNLENYFKPLMLYVWNNVTWWKQSIVKIIEFYNYLLEIYKDYKDKSINDILEIKLKEKPKVKEELEEKIIKHINENFAQWKSSQKLWPLLEKFFNIDKNENNLHLKLSWIKKWWKNDIVIWNIWDNEAFLAIYIWDENELFKVLDEKFWNKIEIIKNPTWINKENFSIEKIAEKNNKINVLIGTTKKFGVGYDNYRISTIWLLDIDKSNIEAVQLFWRWVRIKGCNNNGKRCYENYQKEKNWINNDYYLYKLLETLYVFSDSWSALQHFLNINELDVKLTFSIDLETKFSTKNFDNLPVFEQVIKKQKLEKILEEIDNKIENIKINNWDNFNIKNLSNANKIEKITKDWKNNKWEIIVEWTNKELFINFYLKKIWFDDFTNNLIINIFKNQITDLIDWDINKEEILGKFTFLKEKIKNFLLNWDKNIELKNNIYLDIKYSFENNENIFKEVQNIWWNLNLNWVDKNELKIKNIIKLIVSKIIKQKVSEIKNNFISYKEDKFKEKQKDILWLKSYSITVNIKDFKSNKWITDDWKSNLNEFLNSIWVEIKDENKLFEEIENILNTSNLKEINLNKFLNTKILDFIIKNNALNLEKDKYFNYLENHFYNYIYSTSKQKTNNFDITIRPDLVKSEIDFIQDLKKYLNNFENAEKLKNYEIYLVRNIPKKWIWFFGENDWSPRYPDFVMWLVNKDDNKDIKKVFIEPHWIRNDIADWILDKISKLPISIEKLWWKMFILAKKDNTCNNEQVKNNENIICMENNYIDFLFKKILEEKKLEKNSSWTRKA